MVKIYGASDDLVEIENSTYKENEIGCYNRNVRIWFSDGTIILIGYPKEDIGVWWIKVEKEGSEPHILSECNDEDADIYSDIFQINSEIVKHKVIKEG